MFQRKRGFRAERRGRVGGPPSAEVLEMRTLLATAPGQIDLTNIATGTAGTTGYGVQEAGLFTAGGAGWTVTDVGHTTNSGFDDFLIGAPTVTGSGTGLTQAAGNNSRVYLIFGSETVNSATVPTIVNWLSLQANQRVGDLGTLGNAGTQTNPTNPTAVSSTALQFNGITFFTSQNPNSELGASVTALGDLNGDGFADFMIGAPGSTNASGTNPGTGRAYIIYGGPQLATALIKTVDLDTPSSDITPTYTIVAQAPGSTGANTLATYLNGAHIGQSVAGVGDVIVDGSLDVGIGAPNALAPPATGTAPNPNAGEVFVLSGAFLRTEPPQSGTLFINDVGQTTNNIPGVVFSGAASGDQAGWSVAGANNVSHTTAFQNQSDLLIGAPGNGKAYFVDAQLNLNTLATSVNGVNSINLANVGLNTSGTLNTGAILGAQFISGAGAITGSLLQLGYSVASSGNFITTSSSLGGSFMIGDPGASTVYLISGVPFGIIPLSTYFNAPNTGAPLITTTTPAGVTQNGSVSGTNPAIFAFRDAVDANALLGFSESAVGSHTGSTTINDIALGAPGTTVNGTAGAGEVYLISSTNNFSQYTSGSVFSVSGTVGISTAGGINGVSIIAPTLGQANASNTTVPPSITTTPAFLGASVSGLLRITGQNGFTTDQDILGDLIIGAPGYSLATYPLPTTGSPTSTRISAGSAFVIEGGLITFTGGNTTTGGGGTGGGGGSVGTVFAAGNTSGPPPANLPLGSSLIPPVAALSTYDTYQPIPESIAYAQFRPNTGWLLRMEIFSGQISQKNPQVQRHLHTLPGHNSSGVSTLNAHVFSRDKYHPGKVLKVHHAVAVIPASRQRNVYSK